ncbi:MAG: hypothetical protein AMXMBFR58_05800 [Phycisphaerae bacterium]|nr:hypothetical protein [Phycisphaerales bacterium]MCK6477612.1 OsmC family protein [Phycisphaerales bacterium]
MSDRMSCIAAPVQPVINGIDVGELRSTIAAIEESPAAGKTTWTIRSVWKGGTRSDHHVESCRIGAGDIPRRFTIPVDEPYELCGSNRYANPQEYLMAALNACMMVGYSAVAALMGITLTRLEVTTYGDIDLRGFLGIAPSVSAGYDNLHQDVIIAGSGTDDEFRRLHDIVRATSPNFFNITRAVPVNSRLTIA